jgi:hypothetical protein
MTELIKSYSNHILMHIGGHIEETVDGHLVLIGNARIKNINTKSLPFTISSAFSIYFSSSCSNENLIGLSDNCNDLDITELQNLRSFKGLPKEVCGVLSLPANLHLKAEDYIPVLLTRQLCGLEITSWTPARQEFCEQVRRILWDGRDKDSMPRELIPTKINQLRELDVSA